MRLIFSSKSWAEYQRWQSTDREILARVNELITQCIRMPFDGIGRPEPLLGDFKGFWSRRITQEHRLIYRVTGKGETQALEIASCRFHYKR